MVNSSSTSKEKQTDNKASVTDQWAIKTPGLWRERTAEDTYHQETESETEAKSERGLYYTETEITANKRTILTQNYKETNITNI